MVGANCTDSNWNSNHPLYCRFQPPPRLHIVSSLTLGAGLSVQGFLSMRPSPQGLYHRVQRQVHKVLRYKGVKKGPWGGGAVTRDLWGSICGRPRIAQVLYEGLLHGL